MSRADGANDEMTNVEARKNDEMTNDEEYEEYEERVGRPFRHSNFVIPS
jgi:hypothetical protein